jgi:class 3 adenylate cyclase/tetratricopeptide (TPR) repeat protein
MRCSSCKTDNPTDAAFCEQCGSKLELLCPACKAAVSPGARFCKKCGTAIAASAASVKKSTDGPIQIADTTAPENVAGERKTVTALFADIKGSMELIEDLDPEEARAIVDPALKLMMEAVQRYGGYVAQSTGDGVFALFGAPVALEDHPQRALLAALRIQQELKRYSDRTRIEGRLPIQARVGVNTGVVVVRSISTGGGRTEYAPVGHSTGIAARMQALAPIGSIAATEQIRKLCEGYFVFKSLGPTKVKGVSEPVNVYEVTGLGPLRTRLQRAAGQGLTKFVEREREMDALRHAADQAKAAHGQVVGVMAEPGVGKSRLFFEFRAKNQSGWMVLEAFSVSHTKASAYLPVLDLLHSYFDINSEDDARKRREKVAGKITVLDRALEGTLPYLFALLGIVEGEDPLAQMDAQVKKRRTFDVIKRILLRESLNQPLIVMFEDLHGIDEQTQEFLNLLADSLANAKILLLVNYRPEYSHQWGSKTYYTQLRLDPLGRDSVEEMLEALLGADSALGLKRFIIEKAEGNPLFIEEIVQSLFEEGALARNGSVRAAKPLAALKIPPTVQGVLASRIDRLPTAEKELLQTLAVIGREFSLSLVRAVSQMSWDNLDRAIKNLQLAEFIYEQPAAGDLEYSFKHALTQQVAQDSLLLERRKDLHEQVGTAIEKLYGDSIEQHLAKLANHYRQSRDVNKAIEFLRRAALQASERSAVAEAETLLRDAIGILLAKPQTPEQNLQECELQIALGALLTSRGFSVLEREQPLRRAYELSQHFGDVSNTFSALFHLGQFYIMGGRLREARTLAESVATPQGTDPIFEACSLENLGECYWWSGDLHKARPYFKRVLEICEMTSPSSLIPIASFDLGMMPAVFLAMTDLLLGWPDRALQLYDRLVKRAQSSAHPYSRFLGLVLAAWALQVRGDPEALAEHLSASRGLEEYSLHEVSGWILQFDGWCTFWRGDRTQGIAKMTEAIKKLGAVNSLNMLPWRLTLLGEMKAEVGEIRAAGTCVEQALERLNLSEEGWFLPEVYRVAAKVALGESPGTPNLAEGHLRHAIELARNQGAKLWEIRATTSLARLLRDAGRRDEARAMLSEVYNWFTEGFDTADLKDAKALLQELSAGRT